MLEREMEQLRERIDGLERSIRHNETIEAPRIRAWAKAAHEKVDEQMSIRLAKLNKATKSRRGTLESLQRRLAEHTEEEVSA
ncbi:MAG: hypothetical protein OXE49_01455 [Gemmatimonadetes bacterium]|nr:hypothetical protein [Gemmatimonadota bacterium]